MNFVEHTINPKKTNSYDGFYFDGKQIIFSMESTVEYTYFKIFSDDKAGAIKLEHSENVSDYQVSKYRRVRIRGLSMPHGRYIRKNINADVNGAIYLLASLSNQKEER